MFPPSLLDRANRGLLVEALAMEEAGASLATGTKWRSASALAPMPTNGAKRPEEGRVWWGGEGEAGVCATQRSEKLVDRKDFAAAEYGCKFVP
jgi:hypothetical protein